MKSKYFVDTVYIYFYTYRTFEISFNIFIIFQIIYIIRIFTIFQRVTKIRCLLKGNIRRRTVTSLQYLPPDVSHFAFNAV